MILKRIDIENFRCLSHLHLELSNRINLIIGNNGSGKTAILDAMAIGLGTISSHLPDVSGISFKKSDIKITEGKIKPYTKVMLETEKGIVWDKILRRDKSKTTVNALTNQKGTKGLLSYLDSEIIDKYNNNGNFSLPVFVYYGVSRAILDIPLSKKGFQNGQKRFESLSDSLQAVNRFKRAFVWYYNKENEEIRIQKEKKDFHITLKELDIVRNAISRMFPDLSEPHIEVNPLRFMIKKDRETLSLEQLSDGYKTMLGLVIDLSFRLATANPNISDPLSTESIVLIDEVDLHLHPSWQTRVLNDLLRTFPKTQFIITTHSPYIVESLNNNLKKYQVINRLDAGLTSKLKDIVELSPGTVSANIIDGNSRIELLDKETNLIDDKLLAYFNDINRTYDIMRDIEWETSHD